MGSSSSSMASYSHSGSSSTRRRRTYQTSDRPVQQVRYVYCQAPATAAAARPQGSAAEKVDSHVSTDAPNPGEATIASDTSVNKAAPTALAPLSGLEGAIPGPRLTDDEATTLQQQPERPCAICDAQSLVQCATCGVQWYCSMACYTEDHESGHQFLCASRKAFEEPTSAQHRRAIFFHEAERKAEFVWVVVQSKLKDSGDLPAGRGSSDATSDAGVEKPASSWDVPDLNPFFDGDHAGAGTLGEDQQAAAPVARRAVMTIQFPNNVLRRNREAGLAFWCAMGDTVGSSGNDVVSGEQVELKSDNQGIELVTSGHAWHPWRGPVLVTKVTVNDVVDEGLVERTKRLGLDAPSTLLSRFEDARLGIGHIDMRDFRDVVDQLLTYPKPV